MVKLNGLKSKIPQHRRASMFFCAHNGRVSAEFIVNIHLISRVQHLDPALYASNVVRQWQICTICAKDMECAFLHVCQVKGQNLAVLHLFTNHKVYYMSYLAIL